MPEVNPEQKPPTLDELVNKLFVFKTTLEVWKERHKSKFKIDESFNSLFAEINELIKTAPGENLEILGGRIKEIEHELNEAKEYYQLI